jgi:hypothetical protein
MARKRGEKREKSNAEIIAEHTSALIAKPEYCKQTEIELSWAPWVLGWRRTVLTSGPRASMYLTNSGFSASVISARDLSGALPPRRKGGRTVVQDDQTIGEENEATSLLVTGDDIGEKKARIAARWVGTAGWKANIIERRHHGDIQVTPGDPPYLLSGLDRIEPRRVMAKHGFDYMIDAGLGHGPHDFEGIQ